MKAISVREDIVLLYRKSFLHSVERGIADVESGHTQTADELRKALQARRSTGNPVM